MADQRITELTALSKAGLAATDVLPIVDLSASETKKVTAKDLVAAGIDLVDNGEIDLAKLDQASATKLGTTALADDAVTYAKLQNVSATDRILGRSTAGAGNVEEIICTAQGRALLDDATAADQRTTLGLGTIATQSAASVAITGGTISGGTISGITDLAIADGGTGASTAADARTNLGLAIGTNVQAYDAGLQSISGLTTAANQTIYTTGADTYAVTGLTAAGRALLDDATAADQRTTLGLGTLATQNANSVSITGGSATLSSASITSATISGGTVTGITDLAIADGGTGASTAADARANLGVAIGTDVQAYDAGLQSIAGLTTAANQLLYTTGTDTYATTSITAAGRALIDDADAAAQRTTLGLGSLSTANSVDTSAISDDAITAAKIADESTVDVVTTLPVSGAFIGQFALVSSTDKLYCWTGAAWTEVKAGGSVNTITPDNTSVIDLAVSVSGDEVTIAAAPENTANASEFLAGPTNAGGAVSYRTITSADIPVATTTTRGAVQVNGEGLRMDGNVIEVDNDVAASATDARVVTYNAKGLVTGGRAIQSADLPISATGLNGVIQPGTGLAVTEAGVLNHSNTVTASTATKITYDAEGHVTSGDVLSASDIPNIPAEKLTSGTLDGARLGTNSVVGAKLANQSVTIFGGAGNTTGTVTFPAGEHQGQFFYDEWHQDLYVYSGTSWMPVTVVGGELVFSGIYNAATNLVIATTTAGAAAGFVVGTGLPAPDEANTRHYVIVATSGTGVSPAPAVALAPPDLLVSTGTSYELIDISSALGSQLASNVTFTPYGGISSDNVQLALQELDDDKLAKAGGTVTGQILIGTTGSLVFEAATDNDFELTIATVDVTADRTATFPDQSGTVLLSGNASIVNADISASAAIAVSKLANGTARQLLQTNAAGTGVEWTSNIDIPGTLDVTGTATFDGTVNISDGTY